MNKMTNPGHLSEQVIFAAGGNATAIAIIDKGLARKEYEARGLALMDAYENLGIEQCGFAVLESTHFEMAGGEFCGNAARSAAIVFHNHLQKNEFEFTMSGFPGKVIAQVESTGNNEYFVKCFFPKLNTVAQQVLVMNKPAQLVDLGGIVHVVLMEEFPQDSYESTHRQVTQELKLETRDAVGVLWGEKDGDSVKMHPVVWVRAIDTFFYETSCGSGSIAMAAALGATEICQPSEQLINVLIDDSGVSLSSNMEVKHVYGE